MENLGLSREFIEANYPEIWKYLEPDDVTDFDYNNGRLWITTVHEIPRLISDEKITKARMERFAIAAGNSVGISLNPTDDTVYADGENLRITCVDKSQSASGISVMIRKAAEGLRLDRKTAIESGYASEETLNMLHNFVLAGRGITFCGLPGWGKTECLKYHAAQIPKYLKVVTIEDVGEIQYSRINPGASGTEFKVRNGDYGKRLESALRMNPAWNLFGESRGASSVKPLLESWSNGVPVMTTLHVDDGRKVPDRILNMLDTRRDSDRIVNQIYDDIGTTVLVEKRISPEGNVFRRISQVCLFWRKDGRNHVEEVVEKGILKKDRIPEHIRREIEEKTGCGIFTDPGQKERADGR